MKRCEHDLIYSGQSNLSRQYAFICRKCGECGWAERYVIDRVDAYEYMRQRVVHGWATPRLPSPPPMPTRLGPERSAWPFVPGAVFFATLGALCSLAWIPWGDLGPIMPLWASLMGAGLGLGTATVFFVCWKKGL